MQVLSSDAIDRLRAGRTLDLYVAEMVAGLTSNPVDPLVPPPFSTNDDLATKTLAYLNRFVPATHKIDEHPDRLSHRVNYYCVTTHEIEFSANASTRAAAVAKFALHFVTRYPEAKAKPNNA